jgi:hypothetical protein
MSIFPQPPAFRRAKVKLEVPFLTLSVVKIDSLFLPHPPHVIEGA